MTAKTYLRHTYHRMDSGFKKARRLLNPAKFYAGCTLSQIKIDGKINLKKTPNIVVEINNTCNLNCIMCETKNSKRPKGVMSVDDFVWILDKVIKPKGQRVLVVHTVGEPLMHPHFDKIADEVYKRNIRLLVTTNGFFLKKYSRVFEKYPGLFAGINVSVDGASKETYDKIRIGGEFTSLIENLQWLTELNRTLKLRIPIGIQSVVSADNLHEIPDYFSAYTKYVKPENILFNMISTLSADAEEGSYYFSRNILGNESMLNAPCILPFVQMHILFDGRISACCRDYHGELIMGDIKKDKWQDIWSSEKYKNMRTLHRLRKTDDMLLCKSCYSIPAAFTVILNNYIQYLVYTGKLKKNGFSERVRSLFKDFSVLYHKKDYNPAKLTRLMEAYK